MQKHAGIIAAFLLIFASSICQSDENADELKRLQGRYERRFTNPGGVSFRSVHEVVGNESTVTTYDDQGQVVSAHSSSFKVETRGPVRVLSFFNLVVTAGPDKGRTDPATRSYIYRFDGQVFSEVWGLLNGDESPPRMFVWQRVKDDKK